MPNAGLPRREMEASCSIIAHELHAAAKKSLFHHFQQAVVEEIMKILCPQHVANASQEPADPISESMIRRQHVSKLTTNEAVIPDATEDNLPYLALVWPDGNHVSLKKLPNYLSVQIKDFLDNSAPVASTQKASMSEEHFSSSDGMRESRPHHKKQRNLIDQESPTNADAFPTSPLKRRKFGDMSSQAPSEPNHPKGKHPIDQASPSNADTLPKRPLKNEKRTRLNMDLINTKKEKRMSYDRKKKMFLTSCRSNGSARTSIDGLQWRESSRKATQEEKDRVRGWKATKQSLSIITKRNLEVEARASRARVRNMLARFECPQLVNYIQMKARRKKLRVERSKIHELGVMAVTDIMKGELIVEYIGERMPKWVADLRGLRYEKAGKGDYFFKIDAGLVIDATLRGGIARYINHSCEPNCETRVILSNGQRRIFIYANQKIKAGTELTYDYKFPFEENKIPCSCGSKRCRKSMN
ncbi:histone-lysine N-methyltransferase set1-like [Brachypodium distachyon]|nr:histone-lysine N-methyltransferase set1-like [Brachypodium distachyon]|eukprot:XP_024316458.1 histone-lysine N-methyltransferase set1-like [Brachypodium distachyon]